MGTLDECVGDVRNVVRRYYPSWADGNESDPGVTLLQLFAFLGDELLYRHAPLPERGIVLASAIIGKLARLGLTPDEATDSIKRVRYFDGQMLAADDFRTEQEYFRKRLRLHNRALHGYGIVSGLEVHAGATTVRVNPGLALDPAGNEITVPTPTTISLRQHTSPVYISAFFVERETDHVPTPHGTEHTRVEETFAVVAEQTPSQSAVPIAKLTRSRRRWRVDKRFKTRHVKMH